MKINHVRYFAFFGECVRIQRADSGRARSAERSPCSISDSQIMDFVSSLSIDSFSIASAAQDQGVVVRLLSSPKVRYSTWNEFSDLLMDVQENYCRCLVASVMMELEAHEIPLLEAARNFSFTLSHIKKQGPRIIMGLTKQEGAWWCAMVAHFVYSRVQRASVIYQHTIEQLKEVELQDEGSTCSAEDDLVFSRRISTLTQILQEEVRYTFSGAMPFSVYTLCSGFVSTLIVDNFTFYNNSELTAFTNSQFEDILLTLCMGLHTRLGASSPLLGIHDEIMLSLCKLICASSLQKHVSCHTFEKRL